MKNLRFITAVGFILAFSSLAMPYSKFEEGDQIEILYGYEYILADVSLIMFLFIVISSWAKRTRTVSLLRLLLSLSNFFFCIFILIAMTVFRDAHSMFETEYMNGVLFLLFAGISLVFVSGIDVYQTFKRKG
ncbi:MAG: hypothetical protein HRT57_08995 [Crocinitomicaceae bacterium]|nr:hypothetical protein [Crocinitomicaceae bacterium]